ncbi:uncharacterized protein LOC132016533 isoform X2 [Mustela nigripes]|uniref:uncharacterized protein LOC132016533 isoform X2 n=1 Tax=Mustela nigripes TaxID=77151 RepID=UPI002814A896|nr:uncharacterized protein LOC132016533 isoform X2 [Mustela nigripes]
MMRPGGSEVRGHLAGAPGPALRPACPPVSALFRHCPRSCGLDRHLATAQRYCKPRWSEPGAIWWLYWELRPEKGANPACGVWVFPCAPLRNRSLMQMASDPTSWHTVGAQEMAAVGVETFGEESDGRVQRTGHPMTCCSRSSPPPGGCSPSPFSVRTTAPPGAAQGRLSRREAPRLRYLKCGGACVVGLLAA